MMQILVNILYAGSFFQIFKRLPILKPLAPFLLPLKQLMKDRSDHHHFTHERMQQRIDNENPHPDFFSDLLKDESKRPSFEFLRTNASSLLIAGAENPAITISAMIYYLFTRPEMLQALQKEIRGAFQNDKDIDTYDLESLPLMSAILKETQRLFSPLPISLPRVSPGSEVDGRYIPEGVSPARTCFFPHSRQRTFHGVRRPTHLLLACVCTDRCFVSSVRPRSQPCLLRRRSRIPSRTIPQQVPLALRHQIRQRRSGRVQAFLDRSAHVHRQAPRVPGDAFVDSQVGFQFRLGDPADRGTGQGVGLDA